MVQFLYKLPVSTCLAKSSLDSDYAPLPQEAPHLFQPSPKGTTWTPWPSTEIHLWYMYIHTYPNWYNEQNVHHDHWLWAFHKPSPQPTVIVLAPPNDWAGWKRHSKPQAAKAGIRTLLKTVRFMIDPYLSKSIQHHLRFRHSAPEPFMIAATPNPAPRCSFPAATKVINHLWDYGARLSINKHIHCPRVGYRIYNMNI
jgi:hypothetical protein